MNPYYTLVNEYARLAREGRGYPLGKFPRCPRPQVAMDAPRALLLSPHPDDEVITGALPLRLLRKSRWNIVNVPVTLGSNLQRREERLAELQACCACIGFGLALAGEQGLDNINLDSRERDPAGWTAAVHVIAGLLAQHQPRAIFFPHAQDWNRTHVGTHWLVADALRALPADFSVVTVETEFWQPMASPNLMIESNIQEVADLVTALSFHAGEVRRNPYHLTLPAWMVDNVRRGGELMSGQGTEVPVFTFATLYRVTRWANGQFHPMLSKPVFVNDHRDPAEALA
jgi:LmbE family N-acetylglucosaminyl deacetylase